MEVHVLRIREDNEGNCVMLHIRLFDHDITLVTLYGLKVDTPELYARLKSYIYSNLIILLLLCVGIGTLYKTLT